MQFSKETIDVLKNFASINSNILFRRGNQVSTISTSKTIFAKASVAESFPVEVPVYDLNSLLALLTLMENQVVEFGDKSLTISRDGGKFEYFYSSPSVIVAAPDKSIEVDNHFQFKLTAEDVQMIMKAAAVTAAPAISLTCKHQQVTLAVGDRKSDTANSYKKSFGAGLEDFDGYILSENFKIVPDAYTVTVSKKKFFHFKNETKPLEYFIVMEHDSVV
jgi:hypothetical protein